jgi:hypothetical protein
MTLQTFSIPGEIAVALSTDRPQFIDIYINNQVDEEKKELGRLIKALIEDRALTLVRLGQLELRLESHIKNLKGLSGVADSIEQLMKDAIHAAAGTDQQV